MEYRNETTKTKSQKLLTNYKSQLLLTLLKRNGEDTHCPKRKDNKNKKQQQI